MDSDDRLAAGVASWVCSRNSAVTLDGTRVLLGYAGEKVLVPSLGRHTEAVIDALRSPGGGKEPTHAVAVTARHVPGYTGKEPTHAVAVTARHVPGYTGYKPRVPPADVRKRIDEAGQRPASEPQASTLGRSFSLPASRFPEHKVYEAAYGRRPNPPPEDDRRCWCPKDNKPKYDMPGLVSVPPLDCRIDLLQGTVRNPGYWRTHVHRDFQEAFERKGKIALEVCMATEAMKPRRRGLRSASSRSVGSLRNSPSKRRHAKPCHGGASRGCLASQQPRPNR